VEEGRAVRREKRRIIKRRIGGILEREKERRRKRRER
jgi:hypothetical protein